MGSKVGVLKIAASRIGLTIEEYTSLIDQGLKYCTKCKQWHPTGEFGIDTSRGDGLTAACKNSRNVRLTSGPGKTERQRQRVLGLSWCRMCKVWQKSTDVHQGLCREHTNLQARERYTTDERYRSERKQHTISRKRGVAPIPPEAQKRILEEFDGLCAYCDNSGTTWDHITPVSRGGETSAGNVVPACPSCNSSKCNRDDAEWIAANNKTTSDGFEYRILLRYTSAYG